MRRMWQIWPGDGSPCCAVAEAQFLADLFASSARPGRFTRDDATALMSILRCGATLEQALQYAPGLKPAALLGAYLAVDTSRQESQRAWDKLVANPTPAEWRKHQVRAGRLYPAAVTRISGELDRSKSAQGMRRAAAQVVGQMQQVTAAALEIEARCASVPVNMPQHEALSALLFSSHSPCLYNNSFYIPSRVSTLSPSRVSALLGERQTS